jgi:hypothetical protein
VKGKKKGKRRALVRGGREFFFFVFFVSFLSFSLLSLFLLFPFLTVDYRPEDAEDYECPVPGGVEAGFRGGERF